MLDLDVLNSQTQSDCDCHLHLLTGKPSTYISPEVAQVSNSSRIWLLVVQFVYAVIQHLAVHSCTDLDIAMNAQVSFTNTQSSLAGTNSRNLWTEPQNQN